MSSPAPLNRAQRRALKREQQHASTSPSAPDGYASAADARAAQLAAEQQRIEAAQERMREQRRAARAAARAEQAPRGRWITPDDLLTREGVGDWHADGRLRWRHDKP